MINLQPTHLENEYVKLVPLKASDFERLYAVASDPLVWEQHPNKDRYQRPIFETFFEGAMASGGAFLILDKQTGEVAGSSRFYDYNEADSSMLIGYTFYGRKYWGGAYNRSAKTLMLDHAFQYVNEVIFHIGANNIRSQTAIQRLGAVKFEEITMAYQGEPTQHLNFQYHLFRADWESRNIQPK